MELTEFISQLATFSGVEQQVRANQRLDGILSALSGDTSAGLAEWIGREVRAPTKAAYEGDPIEVGFAAADGADRNLLVVKNAFGSVVASRTLDSGATEATWDWNRRPRQRRRPRRLYLRRRELRRRHAARHPDRNGLRDRHRSADRRRQAHPRPRRRRAGPPRLDHRGVR